MFRGPSDDGPRGELKEKLSENNPLKKWRNQINDTASQAQGFRKKPPGKLTLEQRWRATLARLLAHIRQWGNTASLEIF
jgi:hypothetical protein